tara:strand:- start:1579 stop:1821 length:243 start_codon:yes stop_codon:yes gene_type:complete
MKISTWNRIMKSFEDLMGHEKGQREVVILKRWNFGDKEIDDIGEREEKLLVHLLRIRYKEILDESKGKDKKDVNQQRLDI